MVSWVLLPCPGESSHVSPGGRLCHAPRAMPGLLLCWRGATPLQSRVRAVPEPRDSGLGAQIPQERVPGLGHHHNAQCTNRAGRVTRGLLSAFVSPVRLGPQLGPRDSPPEVVMFWGLGFAFNLFIYFIYLFYLFRERVNANILGHFTKQISYPVMHQLKSSGVTCTEALFREKARVKNT